LNRRFSLNRKNGTGTRADIECQTLKANPAQGHESTRYTLGKPTAPRTRTTDTDGDRQFDRMPSISIEQLARKQIICLNGFILAEASAETTAIRNFW